MSLLLIHLSAAHEGGSQVRRQLDIQVDEAKFGLDLQAELFVIEEGVYSSFSSVVSGVFR